MVVVDSCGWLEWFTDGQLANQYQQYLENRQELLVPAIVLHEVYKFLKREAGEEKALLAFGHMKSSKVIPLDESLALLAADVSLRHNLAMADAIVYAVALANNCHLITSDQDLDALPLVTLIPKTSGNKLT
jgi:predicted nucleic acid-binding protein